MPSTPSSAGKDLSDDKIYCFASPISSLTFRDAPSSILPEASDLWTAAHALTRDILQDAQSLN